MSLDGFHVKCYVADMTMENTSSEICMCVLARTHTNTHIDRYVILELQCQSKQSALKSMGLEGCNS